MLDKRAMVLSLMDEEEDGEEFEEEEEWGARGGAGNTTLAVSRSPSPVSMMDSPTPVMEDRGIIMLHGRAGKKVREGRSS